jgi:hypothetical protein
MKVPVPRLPVAAEERLRLAGLGALLLGLVLVVAAIVAVSGRGTTGSPLGDSDIVASASLVPRVHLFGDTVQARVRVVLDRRRLDPGLVRLETNFAPYVPVRRMRMERRDDGDLTELRYAIDLRCLRSRCLPDQGGERRAFFFQRVGVVYRRPAPVGSEEGFIGLPLPRVEVVSHLSPKAIAAVRAADPLGDLSLGLTERDVVALWRANPLALPAVSYGVSPGALAAILLALSLGLLAGSGALAWTRVRSPAPVAPAEPEPVVLPPLGRALGALDAALANGHVADQRRALDLLAHELTTSGEEDLADDARELAWAEGAPPREQARTLVARVRRTLEGRSDGHLA